MADLIQACLSHCTEAQKEAIQHVEGPLLVLAGAGSGKTRVITRRIAYLIAKGVDPKSILAITFTNKAAGEMRERVEQLGGTRGVWVATFHATCARILRMYADRLGYSADFSIYDTTDSLSVVKRAMKDLGMSMTEMPPGRMAQRISAAKNAFRSPSELESSGFSDGLVAPVYQRYEELLKRQNALDFDNLLLKTVELLAEQEEIRERLRERFRFLLVDEYQDTNRPRYLIAKTLAAKHRNFCATGDPDQSIYAWRGADINNILDFEKDYPDARVVRLEQNYRSTKRILKAASGLISRNLRRKEKALWTENVEGSQVRLRVCEDESDEARYIAEAVRDRIKAGDLDPSQVAVFYRTNAQSRAIETGFRTLAVPYTVVQGLEFYQRKEVKDLLAYLRLQANPSDAAALERIANVPPRKLGAASLNRFRVLSQETGAPLSEVLTHAEEAGVRGVGAKGAAALARLLGELIPFVDQGPAEALRQVVQRTRYREYLEGFDSAEDRIANVEELVTAATLYEVEEPEGGIIGFLERSALVSDVDDLDTDAKRVSLMTLHCAKGLEFDVVFIVGLEEGLIPLSREEVVENLEEERRLFFVGMTRARKELHLSYCSERTRFGRTGFCKPSRFIEEIPAEAIERAGKAAASMEPTFATAPKKRRKRASSLLEDAPFRTGDLVEHPTFGTGKVLGLSGFGEMRSAMVHFRSVGVKQLVLKYAGLEKA